MTLGNKLRDLRKNNNMTQENLADYLNVSRQSISKWESDETYPETDKLIILSDLFKVSLDYLLKDENNHIINNEEVNVEVNVLEFKKQHNLSAIMIALGTFILLNGISLMMLLVDVIENNAIVLIVFFIPLITSVGLFIFFGMKLSEVSKVEYNKTKDFLLDKKEETRCFIIAITIATVILLMSVFSMAIIYAFMDDSSSKIWPASIFMSGISLAIFIYTYMGIRISKFQDKKEEADEENHIVGAFAILATVAYLIAGFIFDMWGEAWVVYPVFILIGVALNKLIYKK